MSKTKLVNKIKSIESSVENTKHKELEPTLRKSEEKYHKLIEIANDAILMADVESGIILEANKHSEVLFGIPAEEMIGMHHTQLYPPEDVERTEKLFKKYAQIGKGVTTEDIFVQHRDGGKIPVEISCSVFEFGNKKIIQGIFRDITERKRIENELSQSKEQMRSILDNTTAVIYLKDTQGKYILINRQYEDLFHISKEEIVGKTDYDIFPKEMADAFQANDLKVLKAQVPLEMEEVALHDDGPHTYISIKFSLFDSNGIPYGVCGVSTDITERKQAEKKIEELNTSLEQRVAKRTEELQKSEERYRLLVDGARIIGWEYNPYEDRFTFVSGKAQEITGYTIEQWSEKGFWTSHIHPKDKDFVIRYCKNATKKGEDHEFEYRMITADGGFIWFRDIVQVVLNNGKVTKLRGIFVDITERKKAEEALQEQKESLEQKNIALGEILGQLEFEKKQIKDNVITNAENLLLPIIEKISLKGELSKYAQLLRKNLQELTSSFGTRLSDKESKLTSREIEICNMIKNGLTSKEIAGLLNISIQTIEKHRSHIRKKLGIDNEKLNLSSVLKTL